VASFLVGPNLSGQHFYASMLSSFKRAVCLRETVTINTSIGGRKST
jgi:hypothetical protein